MIGDTNDEVYESETIEEFLKENKSYNVIREKHAGPGPAMYNRGYTCLDMVAISNSIDSSAIVQCEYIPFHERHFSNY